MIYQCDVMDWVKQYQGPKFHALLSDPPYHLDDGFMGKDWDKGDIAFTVDLWTGLAEHLLPGAFGFVFSSSDNYWRIASVLDAAGMRIHPNIFNWVYGSGMGRGTRIKDSQYEDHRYGKLSLRSAVEPIICFQKPYKSKPQESISVFGAGAINIELPRKVAKNPRYPSNIAIDARLLGQLDEHTKESMSEYFFVYDWIDKVESSIALSNPVLYSKKPDRKERDYGLDSYKNVKVGVLQGRQDGSFGKIPIGKNDHPTVKPIRLTSWLASMLLPPDNVNERSLLNPFSGSGSEAIGAISSGWERVTLIERDAGYARMSRDRIFANTGTKFSIVRFDSSNNADAQQE